MGDNKFRVEKFNGQDFGCWKIQMEAYLYQKDLDGPLLGLRPAEADKDPKVLAEWNRTDKKALGAIQLALSTKTLYHITKAKTAKEAMEILTNMYEKPSASNQIFLLRRLVNMRLTDRGSVAEHVNNFSKVTGQLESAGVSFNEKIQALLFLCSLSDSYDTAVQAISGTMTDSTTLNDVVSSIMNEEMRRKASAGEASGSLASNAALYTESRRKHRGKKKSKNQKKGESSSESDEGSNDDGGPECWHCHKRGHWRRNCKAFIKKKQESHAANVVDNELTWVGECLSAREELNTRDWCVDSGASFHYTSRREVFEDYRVGSFGDVIVGNGHRCSVAGIGTIRVQAQGGGQIVLREARHVPNLRENLISASRLDEDGMSTSFGCGEWSITDGSKIVASGRRVGTLYLLRGDVCASSSAVGSHPESRHELCEPQLNRDLEDDLVKSESCGTDAEIACSVGVDSHGEEDSSGEHGDVQVRVLDEVAEAPSCSHDVESVDVDTRDGIDESGYSGREEIVSGVSQSVSMVDVSSMEVTDVESTSLTSRGFIPCPVLTKILGVEESCDTGVDTEDRGGWSFIVQALQERWWGGLSAW